MYGDASFTCVGVAVSDAEFGSLANGTERAVITVAVNTPRKQENGEWTEDTTWMKFAFFGPKASTYSVKSCRKGTPVFIKGKIVSYVREVDGKKYTMYTFRPEVLRPMATRRSSGDLSEAEAELPPPRLTGDETRRYEGLPSSPGVPIPQSPVPSAPVPPVPSEQGTNDFSDEDMPF